MPRKHLPGGHFPVAMAPEALHPGKAPTLPWKIKVTSKCLFHYVSSEGDISESRSVWNILGSCFENTLCIHLDTGPRGQNSQFFPGEYYSGAA